MLRKERESNPHSFYTITGFKPGKLTQLRPSLCGKYRIRTYGAVTPTYLANRLHKPLGQFSSCAPDGIRTHIIQILSLTRNAFFVTSACSTGDGIRTHIIWFLKPTRYAVYVTPANKKPLTSCKGLLKFD